MHKVYYYLPLSNCVSDGSQMKRYLSYSIYVHEEYVNQIDKFICAIYFVDY